MKTVCALLSALVWISASDAGNVPPVQTVFLILLENNNWADIEGSPDAPFINSTLLPMASYCEQYYNPLGNHPSEPNYIWLEAGTNYGVVDDNDPSLNHLNTTNHLVTQLVNAGISWKTYQEGISGADVPLEAHGEYVPRHNPFVYFDDITGTNNPHYAYGIAHIRPLSELADDLASHSVARYNFITPDLCDDGHDVCPPQNNSIRQIDDWLSGIIPQMLDSAAYTNNGAIFITWDEGEGGGDGPIGMIVLSPLARGGGYFNSIHYTHSSCLRTMQEIFGVTPLLNDAANATDLSDLFPQLTIQPAGWNASGGFTLNITGVLPGQTNFVETSTDLATWNVIATNQAAGNSFSVTDTTATNRSQFYRVRQGY